MTKTSKTETPPRSGVAFIVPTLKRPDFLRRCLDSIEAQTIGAAGIFVGIRTDDDESLVVVRDFELRLPVRSIKATGVGVIGSMAACLLATSEEYVALVDDDVELPPHWLETMLRHLAENPNVLAAAGRDFLQDHPELRRTEGRVGDVGRFHWYGRITGNHHRGGGEPRCVHILRGSNCLFRSTFLQKVGFEQELRGKGAQVNWELALACQAMRIGHPFFYDPTVEVIHHTAPRQDDDVLHRGGFAQGATSDSAFNETFVLVRHGTGIRKWMALAYQVVVGSSFAPGILHFCRQVLRSDRNAVSRLVATLRGRYAAVVQSLQKSLR